MKITLKCFSHVKYALGENEVVMDIESGSTTADLEARVRTMAEDKLEGIPLRVSVNRAFVPDGHALADGDEVAFIPPVQGG